MSRGCRREEVDPARSEIFSRVDKFIWFAIKENKGKEEVNGG